MDVTEHSEHDERLGGHMFHIHFEDGNDLWVNGHALRGASCALRSIVDEAKPGSKTTLDVPSGGFEFLAHWLKEGKIEHNGATDLATIKNLCSAYQIGERFSESPHFIDAVMDALVVAVTATALGGDARTVDQSCEVMRLLNSLFDECTVGRAFVVDWIIHGEPGESSKDMVWADSEQLAGVMSEAHNLQSDVCVVMMHQKLNKATHPWVVDGCAYHIHNGEGYACYRT
ncbi:hypothetical protein LTR56_022619 [Elasticomyces elasticus]|nr:hypothetical protein LTR56_022619 [Elasticomyces elasticus]KAK3628414.1 hypothetical protein LTR22_022375 [Elasticomyces elasticus]KAK4905762.1 hypothetical protein LTR49_024968 [Elasticomyces elasticus]KAK5743224.1 hypothetical protein LTS12_023912 [Elasticomyces elasticus]